MLMSHDIRTARLRHVVLAALILGLVFLGVKYKCEHTFNTSRWLRYPDERVKVVDDLLRQYDLVGLSKDQVIDLLGPETENAYFKEPGNMVYYLGPERGLISLDSEWLVIELDDHVVIDCQIKQD